MPDRDFNILQIGCGYWGSNLAKTFNSHGYLSHLCDQDYSSALMLAKEINNSLSVVPLEGYLSIEGLDAVSIATPAETHFEIAKNCLNNNLHVYIEKPITLRSEEAQELIDLSEKKGLIIQAGHLLLYHPALIKMQELIESNKIGDVKYIYSNRLSAGQIRTFENVAWSFMPHDISMILHLINSEVKNINYHGSNIISKENFDSCHLNLTFKSGVKAHIFASWCNPFKEHKLVVVGQAGSLIFEDSLDEKKLSLIEMKMDNNTSTGPTIIKTKEVKEISIDNDLPLEIACKSFVNCCKEKKEPIASAKQAMKIVQILERIE